MTVYHIPLQHTRLKPSVHIHKLRGIYFEINITYTRSERLLLAEVKTAANAINRVRSEEWFPFV